MMVVRLGREFVDQAAYLDLASVWSYWRASLLSVFFSTKHFLCETNLSPDLAGVAEVAKSYQLKHYKQPIRSCQVLGRQIEHNVSITHLYNSSPGKRMVTSLGSLFKKASSLFQYKWVHWGWDIMSICVACHTVTGSASSASAIKIF